MRHPQFPLPSASAPEHDRRSPGGLWRAVFAMSGVYALCVLCLLGPQRAAAAPVAVPDPQEWARLSPAEQAARRDEIKRQLQVASPAERQAFRQQMRQTLESLKPEDRRALVDRARQRWDAMSPEERRQAAEARRAQIAAMSPEQREDLLRQRRAMLDKLSPAERQALREKLPAP